MSSQALTTKRIPDPKVIPPYYIRRILSQLFSPVMLQILPQLLPRIPPWIKTVLISLVLINIKSFPLLWHFRVLGAAVISRNRARIADDAGKHDLEYRENMEFTRILKSKK